MEKLRDLHEVFSTCASNFQNGFDGNDILLPLEFKSKVKMINGSDVRYNLYSAIITTPEGANKPSLKIFLPNQWFYIASYFLDGFNEVKKYGNYAKKVFYKKTLEKQCLENSISQGEISNLKASGLDSTSQGLLIKFVTNYNWWHGGKALNRNDYYFSPILSFAGLVNASQSYVSDLCVFFADHQDLSQLLIKYSNGLVYEKSDETQKTRPFEDLGEEERKSLYEDYLTLGKRNYKTWIDCDMIKNTVHTKGKNSIFEIDRLEDINDIYHKVLSNPLNGSKSNRDEKGRLYLGYPSAALGQYIKAIEDYTNQISQDKKRPIINCEQTIYFGTPGSGKSHEVEEMMEKEFNDKKLRDEHVIRTIFYPDSDYSTFVGSYKPVVEEDENNHQTITYKYTPQAFINAYTKAWKDLSQPYYLIIEEINRGNCAQIFGDIFQLLDRISEGDREGYSEYPIQADNDLQKFLSEDAFKYSGFEGIANGKLCLPPNLSIIATMNTSDQSLFPMDSAFKRRWKWVYVPTGKDDDASKNYKIEIGGNKYSWHLFQTTINNLIKDKTSSEDKQMGNFFIKNNIDENGIISESDFIGKVMFYLWAEICKENYHTQDNFFLCYKENGSKDQEEFSFNQLYEEGSTQKLIDFMDIWGIKVE